MVLGYHTRPCCIIWSCRGLLLFSSTWITCSYLPLLSMITLTPLKLLPTRSGASVSQRKGSAISTLPPLRHSSIRVGSAVVAGAHLKGISLFYDHDDKDAHQRSWERSRSRRPSCCRCCCSVSWRGLKVSEKGVLWCVELFKKSQVCGISSVKDTSVCQPN